MRASPTRGRHRSHRGWGGAPRALPGGHPDALPAHSNHRPEQPNALPEHPDACESPPRAAERTQPVDTAEHLLFFGIWPQHDGERRGVRKRRKGLSGRGADAGATSGTAGPLTWVGSSRGTIIRHRPSKKLQIARPAPATLEPGRKSKPNSPSPYK